MSVIKKNQNKKAKTIVKSLISVSMMVMVVVACDNKKNDNNAPPPILPSQPPIQQPGYYPYGNNGQYGNAAYNGVNSGWNAGACPNGSAGGNSQPQSLAPDEIFRGTSEGPQSFHLIFQWSLMGDPSIIQQIRNYNPSANMSRSYQGAVTGIGGNLIVNQVVCDQEAMAYGCYQNNSQFPNNGSIGGGMGVDYSCVIPPGTYTLSLAQPGQWLGRSTNLPEIIASGPVQFVMSLNNGGVYFDSMCARQDRVEGHIRILRVNGRSCNVFGTYIN